jgi:antitoxin (DNA-binding transcriptional repressor) of toxin-antitoxin stability system
MTSVGVRELRQNLSVYLDRIKKGETLAVTEFGREVALLTPLPKREMDVFERMVAEGRATAPTRSLRNLPVPTPGRPGMPPAEVIISEMREDKI